ncbi:hypothetical protein IF650_10330 [Cellulosimicrobium terreum]|nr:hypothetical protein [Cellulosimicrobium terreum]
MESTAGLAALALFVLWIGFYVPQRVRHRQQLLEARTDDRFSGSLRVLAVAGPGGVAPAGMGVTLGGVTARVVEPPGIGDRSIGRTHEEEGQPAMESTVTAEPARPVRQRATTPEQASSSRLAVLERRAAAARRRLALTVVLLLASVAVWAAVAMSLTLWWIAAIPTALLAVVLVLGRRAVLSAKRSDAAWLTERRAAARAARGTVLGSPPAPRGARPRVTGLAVHGSQTSTQMIPRVTTADLARRAAAASVPVPAPGRAAGTAREERDASPSASASRDDGEEPDAAETIEQLVDAPHEPTGRAWDPVPVPAPTYTMKPTAPRREPAPLTPDDVTSADVAPAGSVAARDDEAAGPQDTDGRAPGDERKPKTETLGLDLNEILARRRAAGE